MSSDTCTKLRTEIQDGKKLRHEFVLRKFAIISVMLGAGSLTTKLASGVAVDLTSLLYLVPLIAIGFDLYIYAEDFRIKRAGEFLKRGAEGTTDKSEIEWEKFAFRHPNNVSTVAFWLVTLVYTAGAAILLWQTNPSQEVFFAWLAAVVVAEFIIATNALRVRYHLKKTDPPSAAH